MKCLVRVLFEEKKSLRNDPKFNHIKPYLSSKYFLNEPIELTQIYNSKTDIDRLSLMEPQLKTFTASFGVSDFLENADVGVELAMDDGEGDLPRIEDGEGEEDKLDS